MTDIEKLIEILANQQDSDDWNKVEYKQEEFISISVIKIKSHNVSFHFHRNGQFIGIVSDIVSSVVDSLGE